MSYQRPTEQMSTQKCAYCGQPLNESSPLAEHSYWESDGVGGHIWSCGACAKDTADSTQGSNPREPGPIL